MTENELATAVIGHAIEVHRSLGPGLLESAYRECLYYDLVQSGLYVEKEKPMPIVYKDVKLDHGYRIDLLVENKLVLELKTVEFFTDVHMAQVLTYLRLGNYKLGLLINFHTGLLKEGIKRIIN
ncbi:MAG: GxxExxY protein [Cyclobacteriaceae bacterium]|nr:GxxExxY protein [Cyclobacteriaceae bacterium]MBX2955214.1 GxxExxY protein [Cyclobacteriaceae bacterium]